MNEVDKPAIAAPMVLHAVIIACVARHADANPRRAGDPPL